MALPIAVADTSILINLHFLNLLSSLSLFYKKTLVPLAVRSEFLHAAGTKERGIALDTFTRQGYFEPCNDFDIIDVDLYHSYKMYGGEAEALSQLKIRRADVFLVDEIIARRIAENEQHIVRGTARILADLEILGLADTWVAIRRLRDENKFHVADSVVEKALRYARQR